MKVANGRSRGKMNTTKQRSGISQLRKSPVSHDMLKDQQFRDDVKATYSQLVTELNSEREQRLKAEAAAKRLAQQLQVIEMKAREDELQSATTAEMTKRLKQALMTERETKLKAQEERDGLKEQIDKMLQQEDALKQELFNCQKALRELQEAGGKAEREHLQQSAHTAKKFQETQMRAAAAEREVDILKGSLESTKYQVQQLQQLVAVREQEHKREMENKYSLDSRELQTVIQEQVAKVEKSYELQIRTHQEK